MENNPIVKIIPIFISAIFLALFALFFIVDKNTFSENENRNLASMPKLETDAVIEGTYMEDIGTYLCDHFPFRDSFINIKTQYEKVLGHNKINNIYLADDNFYIEPYIEPVNTDRIIGILNKFADKTNCPNIALMLVPTATEIYKDKLPANAVSADQLKVMSEYYSKVNMNTIDVSEILMNHNDDDNLYFHLDHHWTTHAAYYAYTKFCEFKQFKPVEKDAFRIETVTNDFKGTVFSKVNDYSVKPDSIDVYFQDDLSLTVNYDIKDTTTDSLYEMSYLDKKDKYSLFLNNINSLITIENNDATMDTELVIIKDSYANCFVPFIVNHYKKVYVFDTRYYRYPVSQFINEHPNVTDVLILYNMNTIDQDNGVKSIF